MINNRKFITISYRIFLSFLFVGYYSSLTMFYHVHHINGQLITHSHPFKQEKSNKTPFEPHTHSSAEYEYFQHLNEANWKDTSTIIEITVSFVFKTIIYKADDSYTIISNKFSIVQLRAPPVNC